MIAVDVDELENDISALRVSPWMSSHSEDEQRIINKALSLVLGIISSSDMYHVKAKHELKSEMSKRSFRLDKQKVLYLDTAVEIAECK